VELYKLNPCHFAILKCNVLISELGLRLVELHG